MAVSYFLRFSICKLCRHITTRRNGPAGRRGVPELLTLEAGPANGLSARSALYPIENRALLPDFPMTRSLRSGQAPDRAEGGAAPIRWPVGDSSEIFTVGDNPPRGPARQVVVTLFLFILASSWHTYCFSSLVACLPGKRQEATATEKGKNMKHVPLTLAAAAVAIALIAAGQPAFPTRSTSTSRSQGVGQLRER